MDRIWGYHSGTDLRRLQSSGGTAVAQWLGCCATNRKVASSIPAGVSGFSLTQNPSDRTMALGSTQPLTEIVPGVFPGGKGGRCVRLTTYHHPVLLSQNLGALTSWNPLGLSRPVMGLLYLYLFTAFWYMTPYILVYRNQRFGRSCCIPPLGPPWRRRHVLFILVLALLGCYTWWNDSFHGAESFLKNKRGLS